MFRKTLLGLLVGGMCVACATEKALYREVKSGHVSTSCAVGGTVALSPVVAAAYVAPPVVILAAPFAAPFLVPPAALGCAVGNRLAALGAKSN